MSFKTYLNRFKNYTTSHSPDILTGVGVSGVLSTTYLSSTASFTAGRILSYEENDQLTIREKVEKVWPLYIPAAISGVLTVTAITLARKASSKRLAAAYSLINVSEKAFFDYQEKVKEQFGVKKEQGVRDDLAQDRVSSSSNIVVVGSGSVLCFESHTGRYFNSDMETLRKAENTINQRLHREGTATLSDLYHSLGLPDTSFSGITGWTDDKILELRFSTVLSEDGRPCISFDYNYVKPL